MHTATILPRAVLLDRDGVINEDSPEYVKSAEEWLAIPGSLEAIAHLTALGIPVAVCTNQAGIGRGKFDQRALSGIHARMLQQVAAAGGSVRIVRFCPHHPRDACRCRKPSPGMINDVCRTIGVEASSCWFVGDSSKDLQAAKAAGCHAVLVRTGNGRNTELTHAELVDAVYDNLMDAVLTLSR